MSTSFHLDRILRRLENLSLEDSDRDKGEELKKFEEECVVLLIHAPDCQLSFKKFAKIYATRFKKPLNQEEYNFKSLADLFRAMPDTLEVGHKYIDWDGNSYRGMVQLTESVWKSALADRKKHSLRLGSKADKLEEFSRDCVRVLILAPDYKFPIYKFRQMYEMLFKRPVMASDYGFRRLWDLLRAVPETVEPVGHEIQLTKALRSNGAEERERYRPKLTLFGKELVQLLQAWPGHKIEATQLSHCYWRYFGRQLQAADYGYARVKDMLRLLLYVVEVEGKKPHAAIKLLPQKSAETEEDEEEEELTCIVCMDLQPEVVLVPCAHNNLCRPCAEKINQNDKKCPIDRIPITGIIPLSVEKRDNFKPRFSNNL